MTLEGWSGEIVRPVMEKFPWAWIFFVPYIIIATFMVLNLFIGIIVDAIQHQGEEPGAETPAETNAKILAELRGLRAEIAALKSGMAQPR
jgi:voltage-gated sodium channel